MKAHYKGKGVYDLTAFTELKKYHLIEIGNDAMLRSLAYAIVEVTKQAEESVQVVDTLAWVKQNSGVTLKFAIVEPSEVISGILC